MADRQHFDDSYANHVATSTSSGAATGAAEGAGTGAMLGPEGAMAGAAVGAVKGAHKARKAKQKAKRARGGNPRRLLIAEFTVCILLLALSPLGKAQGEQSARQWMTKGSAMCLLFVVLGLIGMAGAKTQKAMAAFGGLVTIALVIDQRGIFGVLVNALGNSAQTDAAIAAATASANAGGAPQTINTPTGDQTITVVPGADGPIVGVSGDF